MVWDVVIATAIGYLLGSIPSGYIAGRLKKGVDIRQVGGGNAGALNVIREIGLLPGLVILIADIAKGSAAVLIGLWLELPLLWLFVAGFAAMAGHNWPVFLRFRGGKGAATTLGVLLALVPGEFAISFAVIAIVAVITSNFRLGIAVGLVCLPLVIWLTNWQPDNSGMLITYSLTLALFLLIRSLPGTRAAMADTGKKNLIFDRERHFWQSKKAR